MNHQDHVHLLRNGVPPRRPAERSAWADVGAGTGAFTLALADLLGPGAVIHAVDRDGGALRTLRARIVERFPDVEVTVHQADFRQPLDLPPLDGLVMANALHFLEDKLPTLRLLCRTLAPGGRFLLVEYNVDRGNRWVPYPLSYETWARLSREAGLRDTQQLATRPSTFLRQFYSALSYALPADPSQTT